MKKENKIKNILEIAGKQVNEMREMIDSLDDDMKNKELNNYIETQEEYVKNEKIKRRLLKNKIDILKSALEKAEKEMVEDEHLSTDTKMKIAAAKMRLKDINAKHTNNFMKIKSTENIIKEEKRKEEENK